MGVLSCTDRTALCSVSSGSFVGTTVIGSVGAVPGVDDRPCPSLNKPHPAIRGTSANNPQMTALCVIGAYLLA